MCHVSLSVHIVSVVFTLAVDVGLHSCDIGALVLWEELMVLVHHEDQMTTGSGVLFVNDLVNSIEELLVHLRV